MLGRVGFLVVVHLFILVTKSCLTLCDSMDCSPPVSLPMGFPRQEHWSGLPFPSLRDLLDPGIERATGRKARGLQTEEISCKCQTFLSLLSRRRKQTSNIFFPSLYKFKVRFLLKYCVAIMTPGLPEANYSQTLS